MPVLIIVMLATLVWSQRICTENLTLTPAPVSSLLSPRSELEQYPIYSAVIEHYVTKETKLLVIWNETSEDLMEQYREDDWKDILRSMVSQDAIDDYTYQNEQSQVLQDLFALSVRYRLIGEKETRQHSRDAGGWWDSFKKRHPEASGNLTVSRIGYNDDLDQALVYVEYWCGFLCATGTYFSLEKNDGAWRIINEHMRWIS